MDKNARRLLAVFAHPDDESFIVGGTLALYAERGWDVRLVCMTSGEGGRRGPYRSLSQTQFAAVRRAELMAACDALGIASPTLLNAPDGAVAERIADLEEQIFQTLHSLRPYIVITFGPDGISGHADHRAVHAIVAGAFAEGLHATRLQPGVPAPRLYYALRSAAVPVCCDRHGPPAPTRTTAINIEGVSQRKLAAMRSHCSQGYLLSTSEADVRAASTSPEYFHRAYPPRTDTDLDLETSLWDDETSSPGGVENKQWSPSASDQFTGAAQS